MANENEFKPICPRCGKKIPEWLHRALDKSESQDYRLMKAKKEAFPPASYEYWCDDCYYEKFPAGYPVV